MLIWLIGKLRSLRRDSRGTAAIEFGAMGTFLVVGVLNVVDMAYYMYQRMEVENAAEVGAQAAWKACYDQSTMLPATVNCSNLNAAVQAAIQSTTLGTSVSLASGYPAEGYYCINSSNQLQEVGSLSSKPADCSAAGSSTTAPGDYIQVGVTYNYAPLFGITVMSAWGVKTITMTSWMQLS